MVQDKLVFCVTSEDAVEAYLQLMKEMETEGFTKTHTRPPEVERLASYSLQQVRYTQRRSVFTNVTDGCEVIRAGYRVRYFLGTDRIASTPLSIEKRLVVRHQNSVPKGLISSTSMSLQH